MDVVVVISFEISSGERGVCLQMCVFWRPKNPPHSYGRRQTDGTSVNVVGNPELMIVNVYGDLMGKFVVARNPRLVQIYSPGLVRVSHGMEVFDNIKLNQVLLPNLK